MTINDGGTLYITNKDSNTVHFAGDTGRLVLADYANFHGTITGFNGHCARSAHSDVIQVADYDFLDANFQRHFIQRPGF